MSGLIARRALKLSLHTPCDSDAMLHRGIPASAKRFRESPLSAQTNVRSEAARSLVQRIVVSQQATPRSAPIGGAESKRARIAASPLTTWRWKEAAANPSQRENREISR